MTTENIETLKKEIAGLKQSVDILMAAHEVQIKKEKHLSILVMSNDYDKLIVAMNMSAAAIASGYTVSLMFTFWGITALRKKNNNSPFTKKNIVEKLFSM